MKIAFGVEYDGSAFCGWQLQEGTRTVQGVLEKALAVVADQPLRVTGAGRTDTGVHAEQQIFHIETEAQRSSRSWVLGGNANLPPDVTLLWALPVAGSFHARFSALHRHYRYIIFNRKIRSALHRQRATWCYHPLDEVKMAQAASYLLGVHDFTSYRARACQANNPVRNVTRLNIRRNGETVILEISANAFLHHMVRNIAGVLMDIGSGKRKPEWAAEVLEARDRTMGGITAPACGLYLTGVDYPAIYALPQSHAG